MAFPLLAAAMPLLKTVGAKVLTGAATSAATGMIDKMFGSANAKAQFGREQDFMDQQGSYNAAQYGKRYQTTVKDMRAAGLNPILAASGGFSVGNSPSVSMPSPGMPQMGNIPSFASSAREIKSIDDLDSQIKKRVVEKFKIIEEAELAQQRAKESVEKIFKMRAEKNLIKTDERLRVRQIEAAEQEVIQRIRTIVKIENEIENIQARTKLDKEKTSLTVVQKKKLQTEMAAIKVNILKMTHGMQELIKEANVYKSPYGSVLVYMRETLKAIGLGIFLPFLKGGVGRKAVKDAAPSYLTPIK